MLLLAISHTEKSPLCGLTDEYIQFLEVEKMRLKSIKLIYSFKWGAI